MYNNHLNQGFSVPVNFKMTCVHHNRISVNYPHLSVFDLTTDCVYVFRISCKDLKSMLSQVNYRVPNMRFLREKLPVTFSPHHRPPPFSLFLSLCGSGKSLCVFFFFFFHNSSIKLCIIGFRVKERRRVVQPVRPALSQPHV